MKFFQKTAIKILLPCAAVLCFLIYFTYPLSFHLGDSLAELGDSRLNTYIQAWGTHALLTHPRQLFDMNMFYPARNTMAGSENLLGNQLLFAPVYLLTGNPVAAQNFVILASFFLSALALYWLLRSVGSPVWAAAVGGLVYGFGLPRSAQAQLGHMQLLSTQWTPVVVLFLFRYLQSKRIVNLAVMTVALVLQVLCSLYLGYLVFLILACCFAAVVCLRPDLITLRVWRDLGLAGLVTLLLLAPVVLPYLALQHQNVIPRESSLTVAASASPLASYLSVASLPHHVYNHLLRRFESQSVVWEKRLFVGFVPLLLSAVGAISLKHAQNGKAATDVPASPVRGSGSSLREFQASLVLGSIFTAATAYVLSLGPVLHIHGHATHIKLPFLLLQRWVPGMGVFRVPARFVFAFMFGIAVLAAFGVFRMLCRFSAGWMRATCSAVVLAFITMEYSVGPLALSPVMAPPRVAPEYRWLADQPHGSVVVELPISGPPSAPDAFEQAGYLYASVYHWQPMINGYSGYMAPIVKETYKLARNLPASSSVDLLGGLGLKFIVIHENKMSASDLSRWQPLPTGVQLVARFDDGTKVLEVRDSRCHADIAAILYRHENLRQASQCGAAVARN